VQWRCSGNDLFYRGSSGFGAPNVDFFNVAVASLQQGEARLKPGMSAKVTISRTSDTPDTAIKIHWPVNEPKPSEISIQTASQ
jgi:hypothetical protein